MIIADVNLNDWTGLVTAITGLVTALGIALSIILGVKRGNKVQAGQAVQIEQGAVAIEQNKRLEQKADQTLQTVNGPLTHALTTAAIATSTLADVTGKAEDIKRSETAINVLKDHLAGQETKAIGLKPDGV